MSKIQINENDIRQMVNESVKRILREQFTQDINPQEVIEIVKLAVDTGNYEIDKYKFTNFNKSKNEYYEGIMSFNFYGEGENEYKTIVVTTPFGFYYSPETYDDYLKCGNDEEINGGIIGVDKVELYYDKLSEGIEIPNINEKIEAVLNCPKFEESCTKECGKILHLEFEDAAEYEDFLRTEYLDTLRKYGND